MSNNTPLEPMELLVDGHHGIYCWQRLATLYAADRFELTFYDHTPALDILANGLFDPHTEDYCDNMDWFCDDVTIKLDGLTYTVEQIDGDIFAVHPDAEWNEYNESYRMTYPDEVKFTIPSLMTYWLVYGQCESINDAENRQFNKFVDGRTKVGKAINRGLWEVLCEDYFSWHNDVTDMGGDVVDIVVYPNFL